MKVHRSVIKRAKQNEIRKMRNVSAKSRIKTLVKNVNEVLQKKDINETKKAYSVVTKSLDKAAQKGIIHKKTANRKKSRLSKKINLIVSGTNQQ
ncbi:MAG: 30S ribosomal protein S20 [bacterium]|nr:30S ribosomal protein S20 [bacterium]